MLRLKFGLILKDHLLFEQIASATLSKAQFPQEKPRFRLQAPNPSLSRTYTSPKVLLLLLLLLSKV